MTEEDYILTVFLKDGLPYLTCDKGREKIIIKYRMEKFKEDIIPLHRILTTKERWRIYAKISSENYKNKELLREAVTSVLEIKTK